MKHWYELKEPTPKNDKGYHTEVAVQEVEILKIELTKEHEKYSYFNLTVETEHGPRQVKGKTVKNYSKDFVLGTNEVLASAVEVQGDLIITLMPLAKNNGKKSANRGSYSSSYPNNKDTQERILTCWAVAQARESLEEYDPLQIEERARELIRIQAALQSELGQAGANAAGTQKKPSLGCSAGKLPESQRMKELKKNLAECDDAQALELLEEEIRKHYLEQDDGSEKWGPEALEFGLKDAYLAAHQRIYAA